MSLQSGPTPFTKGDWTRRLEMFEATTILVFAVGTLVAVVYGTVLAYRFSIQFLMLFVVALGFSGVSLLTRQLARRGHLDLAIYILLMAFLLLLTVSSLVLEGIVIIAGTFYVATIVTASVLLGSKASFAVAGVSAVLYLVVSLVSRGHLVAALVLSPDWMTAITSFISALTFFFTAYMGWLTTRDLRHALQDATYDLVEANKELQEANQLKTRFLARVSHELRTPLNSIIGYTDMNLVGIYGDLNDAQRDALERVKRNSHQLLCLINDVLDLSRIEADELELQSCVYAPEELVRSVIETVRPRAQEKGLELTYVVDPGLPAEIMGDQVRLNQVLLNLVDNAIKFTTQGSIHVDASSGTDGAWTLRVQDTGRGISERELPHIFEEFRQGEGAHVSGSGGAGLGLAIAQRLVEAMGGNIRVHSRLGIGSTFTVTLPVDPAPETQET